MLTDAEIWNASQAALIAPSTIRPTQEFRSHDYQE